MNQRSLPNRLALVLLAVIALAAPAALAQDSKAQQLKGIYLGLTSLGVGTTPFAVELGIEQQDNRSFTGALSFIEQDNLAVSGTIAASGKCTIQADSTDGKSSIKLNWLSVGEGGAALTGASQVDYGDGSVRGTTQPIAFLRPYNDLDVDWGDGSAKAEFLSHSGGVNAGIPIDFLAGTTGLFDAAFVLGSEHFEIVGTSNSAHDVLAVGVGGSQTITITGIVRTDAEGVPVDFAGSYLIQTSAGKIVDSGIIAILIG